MRQTILSLLLAVSPVLAWGQGADASSSNQPAPAQLTVNQITVNQSANPNVISCIGNFGGHYTVQDPPSRLLTPEDPVYGRNFDYRALMSSGCGYNTVAPIPQDIQAFRK